MFFSSWQMAWGRGGGVQGVTPHAEPRGQPGGAGAGLEPSAGAASPGGGPRYLRLCLLPLVRHRSILQLLQPPLQLLPHLSPLPHLAQQHVAGVHPFLGVGLELLLGHLDGHASIQQAGGRACWAPAAQGGPACKTAPRVELGTPALGALPN